MSLPKDPERGSGGNCWYRAGPETDYLLVRSEVGWFLGHWSAKLRGSCRCLGELCPICAAGSEPYPFYYIAVSGEDAEIKFLEIPRRHRRIAESLDQSETGGVGFRIRIQKEGSANNSPINLEILGFEDCDKFDVWPFVATLGRSLMPIPDREGVDRRPDQSESVPAPEGKARVM